MWHFNVGLTVVLIVARRTSCVQALPITNQMLSAGGQLALLWLAARKEVRKEMSSSKKNYSKKEKKEKPTPKGITLLV